MSRTIDQIVEDSWTLVGARRGKTWRCRRLRHRSGQAASVTADGQWTMLREESRGDVVGFMHTHPMGGLAPSLRDVRTMRAWCDALGKSLLCVITTPDAIGGWRFDDYRSTGTRLAKVELVGKTQLIGVESHARNVSPRAALPRRGTAGQARGPARNALRRGRGRLQPR
jgi:proteasome lid subunit RPN8/RPN11